MSSANPSLSRPNGPSTLSDPLVSPRRPPAPHLALSVPPDRGSGTGSSRSTGSTTLWASRFSRSRARR